MKDFALKLIEPKVFITILVSGLIIYGIYKGIIGYTDLIKWFEQILKQIKITIG